MSCGEEPPVVVGADVGRECLVGGFDQEIGRSPGHELWEYRRQSRPFGFERKGGRETYSSADGKDATQSVQGPTS